MRTKRTTAALAMLALAAMLSLGDSPGYFGSGHDAVGERPAATG